MNPVNATTLYVSACRAVLLSDPRDPRSLAELCRVLPCFRQSLSCLVCGNLLRDPIALPNASCQHYVCKGCKGQKMTKLSCSWCKDHERFEENRQLCILVDCYRKLCEYVAGSPLAWLIAGEPGGSTDLLATLSEGLSLSASEAHSFWVSLLCPSEDPHGPLLELPAEIPGPPDKSPHGSVDSLAGCNGLPTMEKSGTGLPPPVEEASGVEPEPCPGVEVADQLGADTEKGGGQLMLTVEEVLQSLEPELGTKTCNGKVSPVPLVPGCVDAPSSKSPRQPSPALAPQLSAPSQATPCLATMPQAGRADRKRSRSESDSEKVQPLPISSIIQGPHLATAAILTGQELMVQPTLPLATVPNRGAPKVGKVLLVANKVVKRNPEPRKAYTKARPGLPKSKDKAKDRTPNGSGAVMGGNSPKAVYKKPQEKRGCKCGRATQNPSVLTCRGQRCPCYSNRKACLDCICRGCQNSYMANGEKKLEAFAVPEKALEQTRLTLGINVTSIAVRSATAGVLNVTAGGPVASFLASSPRDDSLDMNFD